MGFRQVIYDDLILGRKYRGGLIGADPMPRFQRISGVRAEDLAATNLALSVPMSPPLYQSMLQTYLLVDT
jgi:hypothetical protein